MKRAPLPGVDLRPYAAALPLLLRNPVIIVVPFLVLVVSVLLMQVLSPLGGGLGSITAGLAQLIAALLTVYGLGSACIMADSAWRRGKVSFDTGWSETQRKSGDLLSCAVGTTLLVFVAQSIAQLIGLGALGLLLMAVVVFFLIWAVPAAAIGGIPGGASIQVSIERVRSAPLPAAIVTIVTLLTVFYLAPLAAAALTGTLGGYLYDSGVLVNLIGAFFRAIAMGYAALVLTKTYSDVSFGRRW